MGNDIEDQLRKSLRHVEPPEGFADRVIARVEAESAAGIKKESGAPIDLNERRAQRTRTPFLRWFPLALAASAVLSVAIVQQSREREEQRGLEARRQLIEALRVTSDKLDSAYHAVNSESKSAPADGSGV